MARAGCEAGLHVVALYSPHPLNVEQRAVTAAKLDFSEKKTCRSRGADRVSAVVVAFAPRLPPHAMPEDKEAVKGGARDDRLSGPVHNHRHREREHVRKLLMAEARDKCHETRAAYVECAKGRTLSLPFYCREPFNAFNDCLKLYTTEEELEKRIAGYVVPTPGSKEAADAARAVKQGGSSPFSGR